MLKAIFYDLQGTLGGEATASIEEFVPYSFSREALSLAKKKGYINIIITNQSKIGKGDLPIEVYLREQNRILQYFNFDGILIDDFLYCPHQNKDNCDCKKPKTGLIQKCVEKYSVDLSQSYVIGDMGKNEIIMAHNAGCKGILVLTGGGKDSLGKFRSTWADHEADMIADNVLEAVKMCDKQSEVFASQK